MFLYRIVQAILANEKNLVSAEIKFIIIVHFLQRQFLTFGKAFSHFSEIAGNFTCENWKSNFTSRCSSLHFQHHRPATKRKGKVFGEKKFSGESRSSGRDFFGCVTSPPNPLSTPRLQNWATPVFFFRSPEPFRERPHEKARN